MMPLSSRSLESSERKLRRSILHSALDAIIACVCMGIEWIVGQIGGFGEANIKAEFLKVRKKN